MTKRPKTGENVTSVKNPQNKRVLDRQKKTAYLDLITSTKALFHFLTIATSNFNRVFTE